MSKKNINLDSINKEWKKHTYSDITENSLPKVKKYYSKLTDAQEKAITKDTIEYEYLPKQKVWVAQTWNGNIAIGNNTKLAKQLRRNTNKRRKEVQRKEKKSQRLKNKNWRKQRKKRLREDKKYYGGKRKMKQKTKKTLKGILAGTLAVGTLVGGIALINHFSNRADENGLVEVNLKYDIGGLDAKGEFEETDESIYTKNAFEAQGLQVTMDFDSNVDYEVFFYDQYGDFISSTGVLDKNFNGEIPLLATHARIEITPQDDADGIKWHEKNGYAKQIEVKVDENQKWTDPMSINKFEIDNTKLNYMIDSVTKQTVGSALSSTESTSSGTLGTSKFVDVTNCTKLQVKAFSGSFDAWNYAFVDADGNFVSGGAMANSVVEDDVAIMNIEIPSGASQFAFTYRQGNSYGIYCA